MTPLLAMADQWQTLSRLLDEALALPPDRRPAWLDRLSGADACHRAALQALLATQAGIETGEFLQRLPPLEPPQPAKPAVAEVQALGDRRGAGEAEAGLAAVLGEALLGEGRAGEALPVLREALDLAQAAYDPRSTEVARLRQLLARAERRAAS